MKTITLIKISLRNISNHKTRSTLTILGIIIGISSVIATLAIGYGAEKKLRKRILSMGKNYIFIHSGKTIEGKTTLKKRIQAIPLKDRDILILKKQCSEIQNISPTMYSRRIAAFKKNNVNVDIKSGNTELLKVLNKKIQRGTFFNKYHISKHSKVVVLGSNSAKELFDNKNPIGKKIKIQNEHFFVLGVIKHIKNSMGQEDPNLDIYMPITTVKKYILFQSNTLIHGINISVRKKQYMHKTVKKIRKILRSLHNLKQKDPDDFTIYNQQAMVKAAKRTSNTLNTLLLIIAAISLLVGGIGVMNIMLVSVSERTKEIGIRIALGATSSTVLKQFLIEAITLCFTGGVLGVILGIITPYIVSIFTKWTIIIKIPSIIFAFLITFFIGLIFGYYPAKKASKLNPVDALEDN